MALGYLVIVWGTRSVLGNEAMIPLTFLMGMYLFHTMGELSLSPWDFLWLPNFHRPRWWDLSWDRGFLSIAFAHKIAGILGQLIAGPGGEVIKGYSPECFSDVYLTWGVYVVLGAAFLLLILSPLLRKWMHGIH
jgi:proton-dependent oligopeptide transporter, POT family